MSNESSNATACLPEHLAERTRQIAGPSRRPSGEFVLYWLHHAMRAHENPALDVAVTISNELQLPLLVYQALPERYPYASDRHHTFILQGARDLEAQFRERSIQYSFYLERPNSPGPHLNTLRDRAAAVITDEMPVEPFRSWIEQLKSGSDCLILAVDTACVVPMRLVGRAYERAFQFRKSTEALYRDRIGRPWKDAGPTHSEQIPVLPFEPVQFAAGDFGVLVADCEIDHAVASVPHTPGGSHAGYRRWNQFKASGLENYGQLRNNPLIAGTSRLSAYLHYGMVSPLRIAREAAESSSEGASKFLDELLVWRELAYSFCFYRTDHESLDALPSWARETLLAHRSDMRPVVHSWETLARGHTGDRLWDAAQRSLLIHGELHNNVRMTWGKSLLNWTDDPKKALDMMIDLNHRYALDGCDPASYGGILWCLGQFDRPFPPARPIFGTVRDRSTLQHAKRLDTDRFWNQATRPVHQKQTRVAVVGAGISGLMCARTLSDHGIEVSVLEKSRGVGGRMATRRTEEGRRFDHGAQYFTVRDKRLERYVNSWVHDGVVAAWDGRICTLTRGNVEWKEKTTPRFVAVPTMNAVCKHLSAGLDIHFNTRIAAPKRQATTWSISDDAGQNIGDFDWFITSAPAPQSGELLAGAQDIRQVALQTHMSGCWAVMLAFDKPLELLFDGAFVHESPLSWVARNSSKPLRDRAPESWVLHASPEWTSERIDDEPETVMTALVDAFWLATDLSARTPGYAAIHRWRYAIPPEPLESRCLFDDRLKTGACGDWCSGSRVEGAFLSGMAMAGRVLSAIEANT